MKKRGKERAGVESVGGRSIRSWSREEVVECEEGGVQSFLFSNGAATVFNWF